MLHSLILSVHLLPPNTDQFGLYLQYVHKNLFPFHVKVVQSFLLLVRQSYLVLCYQGIMQANKLYDPFWALLAHVQFGAQKTVDKH